MPSILYSVQIQLNTWRNILWKYTMFNWKILLFRSYIMKQTENKMWLGGTWRWSQQQSFVSNTWTPWLKYDKQPRRHLNNKKPITWLNLFTLDPSEWGLEFHIHIKNRWIQLLKSFNATVTWSLFPLSAASQHYVHQLSSNYICLARCLLHSRKTKRWFICSKRTSNVFIAISRYITLFHIC
jgi:hypothetical protein